MNVFLADDHTMLREALRAVLTNAGIPVVGEAGNGREAIAQVERSRPDVVLMDVSMPELNGIDATRILRAKFPRIRVIGLSVSADRRYVIAMLRAGATGYLLKRAASRELLVAVDTVARGETYLSPVIAGSVVDEAFTAPSVPRREPERPLSVREREVLQLVAEGKSSKEIAAALHLAVPTVDTHRRQIMEKLNLRTIADLTRYAIRQGLTSASG